MHRMVFKVCIFGDGGVGKTSLLKRFVEGKFDEDTKMTIGVNIFTKDIETEKVKCSLQLWDFAGEERFRFMMPGYILGASGAIFMYDITRLSTLLRINNWIKLFNGRNENFKRNIPILMVGSKSDLEYKRTILSEDINLISTEYNLLGPIDCSSKTGQNVEKIFIKLVNEILDGFKLINYENSKVKNISSEFEKAF